MNKRYWLVALLTAVAELTTTTAGAQIRTAHVTGGTVAGVIADGLSTFEGIPFAAAPVGPLRWRAPQPVKPWSDALKADHFGAACMQEPGLARQMGYDGKLSENCLFLDVWTPAKSPGAGLPVIVWIYGGGYFSGMTSIPLYNGANFAHQGVVFVSVSYRLGPFGFLASPALSKESGHGSGNYGLLDMIAGLKWVQANVAKFGGDPTKVTILGHSAGANAVSRLAASPLARGLFRAVIAESGPDFSLHPTSLANAESIGDEFLGKLGAGDLNSARELGAEQIEAATDAKGAPRFPPPIDGYVVPADQIALWKTGRFNHTPILIGSTSDEAAAFGTRKMTPRTFEAEVRQSYGAQADAMLAAYPHGTSEQATRSEKFLRRDTGMAWPAWTWARLQTEDGGGKKAYVYYFDRPTARDPDGSGHGSEIALVFDTPDHRPGHAAWTDADRAISKTMQGYWVNFAKTGNPNGAGLPNWPAFTGTDPQVMRLGAVTRSGPVPNLDKLQAIDSYYQGLQRSAAPGR